MNETGMTELAVAVGRIEEKVSRLQPLDDRLRAVEKTVERLDARQPEKKPWWLIAGGVAAIVATLSSVVTLVTVFSSAGA